MSGAAAANSWRTWALVTVSLGATLAAAGVMFVVLPAKLVPQGALSVAAPRDEEAPGVQVTVRAGEVEVTRALPGAAFALQSGQTLDPRLAPGPFEGSLTVTFDPVLVPQARIGAVVENLSVAIERRGVEIVAARDGEGEAAIMSEPVFLPPRPVTFVYRFKHKGNGPARLQAMWRPHDAAADLPLPVATWPVLREPADQGLVLVQRLNCARCHPSDDPGLQAKLLVNPPPLLGRAGERLRPPWIRRWLAGPGDLRPEALMPALFSGSGHDLETVEDLTALLASWGGPISETHAPDADLAATGEMIYHRVGCVACHGAMEPGAAAADPVIRQVAGKTTTAALAAFLKDPLRDHPAGRMPSLLLDDLESAALASYLVGVSLRNLPGTPGAPVEIDRAARGLAAFASRGCANCHDTGPGREPVIPTLSAPGLEKLVPLNGCLAERVAPGLPDYRLTAAERGAIAAFLEERPRYRSTDVPIVDLASAFERLQCLSCHNLRGAAGPTPATDRWFTTLQDADVGEEGRLPPDLGGAGARLTPAWINQVLEQGARARPFMATRMPQFGAAAIGGLDALLACAAGVAPAVVDRATSSALQDAEIGRSLVGAGGFNCIQCHSIAGRPATSTPGPDLVEMPRRLRYEHFERWLLHPMLLRPGTRMPTFFSSGRSGLDALGGDGPAQVAAIWSYLAQGEFLPLPAGLTDPGEFEIDAGAGPVVLRTFMEGIGPRAIACGFPQRVNYAFDAASCALRMVWVGRFLNASGAWGARGGSDTDPDQPPVWTGTDAVLSGTARFRGYRLDAEARPVFLYDLVRGATTLRVSEQPRPGGAGLVREFDVQGPPGTELPVNLPAGHRFSGDELTGRTVTLDARGKAHFALELTW